MNYRYILPISLFLLLFLAGSLMIFNNSFAQDKVMPFPEQNYYNLNPNGGVNGAINSTTPPPPQKFSPEKQTLLDQIDVARKSGNVEETNKLLDKLNKLEGRHSVPTPSDSKWQYSLNPRSADEGDFVVSTIFGLADWAHAVCTEPVGATHAGRIWVATTQYVAGGDSLKLYYSDNGGNTWTYFSKLWANINIDFRSNELDIEPVWDGATAWLFGVAGYNDLVLNQSMSVFFRFNLTNGTYYATTISPPGSSTTTNQYYNPRITSDNIAYQTGTWIFMVMAMDSLYGSTNHYLRQKGITCTNPTAATPTLDYTQPNTNGGWPWFWMAQPAGVYQYVDVGWYFPTTGSGDMMYVSTSFSYYTGSVENGNVHNAWSTDRGYTTAGQLTLTETVPTRGTRIAFNGGLTSANQNGMLVYDRQYSATDWDVRYQNTTNGGITAGGWTAGYIDFTSLVASGLPDVIAYRGGLNTFKATFSQGNGIAGGVRTYYSGFSGTSWSPSLVVSAIEPDTVFGCSRAGYVNGGGDDCLIVWRGSDAYTRASRLCTTTGIIGNNTEIPKKFSLHQNYPNPFNPTTNIKFDIPKNTFVKITVFDILGKDIATLVNENLSPGTYNVDWNASQYTSGIYFYRLEAGNFTDTKKLILIK